MKFSAGTIKRIFSYLTPYRMAVLAGFLIGAVAALAGVASTFAVGRAVDQMVGIGKVRFPELTKILLLLVFIYLATSLAQYFAQRLANHVSYQAIARLRNDCSTKLNVLPVAWFDSHAEGDILSRYTNDMDNIAIALTSLLSQAFLGVPVLLLSLAFMLGQSRSMTLIVLIATPLIIVVNYAIAFFSQKSFARQQSVLGKISGFVNEHVSNQMLVKAFQHEDATQAAFEKQNQRLYRVGQKAQFASSLANPSARFVDHLAYIAIGAVGGLLLLRGGRGITIGVITSFTLYASQFSKPFIDLSGITSQIQTALVGAERSFMILESKEETPDPKTPLPLETVRGAVAFEHVYFSYVPSVPLIRDFNLRVSPGEMVAIVGKTGAGKSTLVNLLMRFYEIDQGRITLDGRDIRQLSRSDLRKAFGMVLQETWLMDGTIAENLRFGNPEASLDEMIEAAKEANIHEFISRLPQGYATPLGKSGLEISAGQKQLLTIARTILAQPPMLILDEATSSVDTLTEARIQAALTKLMEGKTSFVIAHRLKTIQNADQILVMKEGQVVEVGDHTELLKKGGYYAALYASQFEKS